ncbi:MAG: hypothetical protein H6Q86_2225, partial [candidate division NC10 bacterium]|nr:hypothetical protein [candidate division NC10 bacterium]
AGCSEHPAPGRPTRGVMFVGARQVAQARPLIPPVVFAVVN